MKEKAFMAGNQCNKSVNVQRMGLKNLNAFKRFLNEKPFQQHSPVFKIPLQLSYLTRCLRRITK